MCGACGERGAFDWARPWTSGLAARRAVAAAALRAGARPGVRVTAGSGGWLVTGPTGAVTSCEDLTALVAAVRLLAAGADPAPPDAGRPSGRLATPADDRRAGVVLKVGPTGAGPRAVPETLLETALAEGRAEVVLETPAAARSALAHLASPAWSRRAYLSRIEGVSEPWGRPAPVWRPPQPSGPDPGALAADVLVGLEWTRQSGRLTGAALAVRTPLGVGAELDVEIRDGHVVRALTVADEPPLRPG
ncbi:MULTISPECIES: hypothetical protein [Streptomyces]|uniref:Uncharacterized protein n=1 Tax=Streptomyces lonegramiae TaxID=3075524 RepID=A0ABU2XFV4_9ACTN|nr:hypothetical protein [Streptomyces sp. DSM 41529]MDT0544334.1 hypothetical protein [Streptomyces sp. DSM 41529]